MTAKDSFIFESLIRYEDIAFHLDQSCIAKELRFTLKNQRYILCFPYFSAERRDGFGHYLPEFKKTRVKMDWIKSREDDNYTFGAERGRRGQSVTSFDCNQFIVRSFAPMNAIEMRRAKRDLAAWKDLFPIWFEVLERCDLAYGGIEVEQNECLECFAVSHKTKKKARQIRSRNDAVSNINIIISPETDLQALRKVLKASSQAIAPAQVFIFLTSARKLLNQGAYRQSVLESATAVEMALTELLELRLKNLSSQQKQLLIKKCKGIVSLYLALKDLDGAGFATQHDLELNICNPRNDAIHKGIKVTRTTASMALRFAEKFIYNKFPL